MTIEEQLAEARATIRRLNRRCQSAEAALDTKVEKFEQRSCIGLRGYCFMLGVDFVKATEKGKGAFSPSFAPFARLIAADGCAYSLGRGRCTLHDSPWIRIELAESVDAVDPQADILESLPRAREESSSSTALRGAPPADPAKEQHMENVARTPAWRETVGNLPADAGRPPTEPAMTPEKQFITPRPFHDDSPECPSCASLTAEIQQGKEQLATAWSAARRLNQCVICRWPSPSDNEHNICECCGFQEGYDHPAAYHWDGQWWAQRLNRTPPAILEAAERAQARLLDGLQQLGQQWRGLADAVPMTDFEQCADQLAAVVSASLIEKPVE